MRRDPRRKTKATPKLSSTKWLFAAEIGLDSFAGANAHQRESRGFQAALRNTQKYTVCRGRESSQ